jgi:hypothetical protein
VEIVEHPEVAAEEDQGQDDRDADKKADPGGEIHETPPASHVGILPRGYAPYRPTLRAAR